MQNHHIRLLIAIMAISLSGLVWLQYRWVMEAIAVKEARFDQTVNEVMQKVVSRMEKLETARLMWERLSQTSNLPPNGIQLTLTNNSIVADADTAKQIAAIPPPTGINCPDDSAAANNHVIFIRKSKTPAAGGAFLGVVLEAAPESLGPGVMVTQVVNNSPAKAAGLREGDIITALDSVPVFTAHDIQVMVAKHSAGDEVIIRYKRPRLFNSPALLTGNYPKKDTLPNRQNSAFIQAGLFPTATLKADSQMVWPNNLDTTALATLAARMEQNYEHIQSIAVEMMLVNKPINERFDKQVLENTLRNTLQDAGIDIPFEYCLRARDNCTFNNNIVYTNSTRLPVEPHLLNTPYRKIIGQEAVFTPSAELLLHFPQQQKYIYNSSVFMLGSSLLFNLIIMAVFAFTMHTIIRQKKLSDMKTDFINNMTHELKTPISTIKLACEILTDKNLVKSEERIERYAGMIQEENSRLQDHVEKVLQFARLEKGNLKLNIERIDMHHVLLEAAQKTMLRVNKQHGNITTNLEAANAQVDGDLLHLTNVIYNLLDNAVKYAKPDVPPQIAIATFNMENNLIISVTDNGIGMGKDTINKIFEQFYRVPTGNIHNVKGFGLGLSYAKLMVEQHGGSIKANSRLGKGSTFEVRLPLAQ
ncbi:PDZ domain-containing protein [Sphingobacteriales bacterium UPWRP_1]|nr:hypothetical protein B6N25_09665 [Sphingobacteriales bacterium TSM_CSS]PSJ74934.1 PDZ domain-containing protein [Sphingobacteriales bacterium UPWRP_1]